MGRQYSFWVKPLKKNKGWVYVFSYSNFFYTETIVDDNSAIRIYKHRYIGRFFNKFLRKNVYDAPKIAHVTVGIKNVKKG